jgi:hypothetical protein
MWRWAVRVRTGRRRHPGTRELRMARARGRATQFSAPTGWSRRKTGCSRPAPGPSSWSGPLDGNGLKQAHGRGFMLILVEAGSSGCCCRRMVTGGSAAPESKSWRGPDMPQQPRRVRRGGPRLPVRVHAEALPPSNNRGKGLKRAREFRDNGARVHSGFHVRPGEGFHRSRQQRIIRWAKGRSSCSRMPWGSRRSRRTAPTGDRRANLRRRRRRRRHGALLALVSVALEDALLHRGLRRPPRARDSIGAARRVRSTKTQTSSERSAWHRLC